MRLAVRCALLMFWIVAGLQAQQQPAMDNASCTFADGKEVSLRYERVSAEQHKLAAGMLFTPGASPMLLFTQTKLTFGDSEVPAGAFRVYLIPAKEKWVLVVNKNVAPGSSYDEKADLARVPMQLGKIPTARRHFALGFVHTAPRQCELRAYYGTTGAWADFMEKTEPAQESYKAN